MEYDYHTLNLAKQSKATYRRSCHLVPRSRCHACQISIDIAATTACHDASLHPCNKISHGPRGVHTLMTTRPSMGIMLLQLCTVCIYNGERLPIIMCCAVSDVSLAEKAATSATVVMLSTGRWHAIWSRSTISVRALRRLSTAMMRLLFVFIEHLVRHFAALC